MIRDFVLSFLLSAALMAGALAMLTNEGRPFLTLKATPAVAISPARVLFRAYIEGPMNEEWYCPKVEWIWPDGTASSEESDCSPWPEGREDAPRIWSRYVLLGAGDQMVTVELSKSKRVFAQKSITVIIH